MLRPYRADTAEETKPRFSRPPIVLARLPYVGSASVSQPGSPRANEPSAQPPLGQSPPLQPDFETQGNRIPAPSAPPPSPPPSSPIATDPVASQAMEHPATPEPFAPQTHFRTDSGHHAHQAHLRSSSEPQPSSGLFELQKQLATNSGLIVALALLASAGLLYMMVIAPTDSPTIDYSDSYQFYVNGTEESPKSSELEMNNNDLAGESLTQVPFDPFALDMNDNDTLREQASPVGGYSSLADDDTIHVPAMGTSDPRSDSGPGSSTDILKLPDTAEQIDADHGFSFDDASAAAYPNTNYRAMNLQEIGTGRETSGFHVNLPEPEVAKRPSFPNRQPANR